MHGFGGVGFNAPEAHYEENDKGKQAIKFSQGKVRVNFRLTQDQMRVLVRMKFVQGANKDRPFLFTGKDAKGNDLRTVITQWLAKIDQVWNNQFTVTNGVSKLALEFVPIIISGADDSYINTIRIFKDQSETCTDAKNVGRAYQLCWFTTEPGEEIAHEFGHMISASDEYKLPATANEIPADIRKRLTPLDIKLTTTEGIGTPSTASPEAGRGIDNSIMNDESVSLQVHERHVLRLVNNINDKLAAGVPRYTVRKK
jgi:hypothetical protein